MIMNKNGIFKIIKKNMRKISPYVIILLLLLIIYMLFFHKRTLETMTTINIYTDEEYEVNNKSTSKSTSNPIDPPYTEDKEDESEKTTQEPEPAPQTNSEANYSSTQDTASIAPTTSNTPVVATEEPKINTDTAIKDKSAEYSNAFTGALK